MNARQKIAVTGATGRVGSHLVELLEGSGHEVVPISRSNGVDVITGEGLEEALAGVDTVVDTATGPSPDRDAATRFFVTAARNLEEAGERAGVRRIVGVSIIGCDRFTGGSYGGYYAAKVTQERALLDGPIPAQILRAAQFHEFVGQLLDWGTRGDVAYVPAMRTQLVAARNVAEALADMATGPMPPSPDPLSPRSPVHGWRGSSTWRACSLHAAAVQRRSRRPATPTTRIATCTPATACCLARTPSSPVRRSRSGWTLRPRAKRALARIVQ